MAVFGAIKAAVAGALDPLERLIDNLHDSVEEKRTAKALVLEARAKIEQSANDIMEAEASHEHWYVAGWRPTYMYVFLLLVLLDSFGLLAVKLAPEMWELMKFGLTGYIGARGIEKAVKHWAGRPRREANS